MQNFNSTSKSKYAGPPVKSLLRDKTVAERFARTKIFLQYAINLS